MSGEGSPGLFAEEQSYRNGEGCQIQAKHI
jgi:hypothetical protein